MKNKVIIICVAMMAAMPHMMNAQNVDSVNVANTEDSLSMITSQANQGNADAQNLLGIWYYNGNKVKQNYVQAMQWWIEAAKKNHAEAIGHLGDCYLQGHGVKQDSTKAEQLYIRSLRSGNKTLVAELSARAEKGDLFSCLFVASCYKNGIGTKRNQKDALRFYTMAAEKGSAEGMRETGKMYVAMMQPQYSISWFERAIEANGDIEAKYYYGKLYMDGKGVEKDVQKGVHYLTMAALNGMAAAQFEMGNAYSKGEGVTQNSEKAFDYYRKAAEQGNRGAMWNVACCYKNGEGVKADYYHALHWYMTAAPNGYQNKLADLMSGKDTGWVKSPMTEYIKAMQQYNNKEYDKAAEAFKKLRKRDVEDAKVMEELCIIQMGDSKKSAKSVKNLTKLAQENSHAALELARMQLTGAGVEKDIDTAVKTLTTLAEQGYVPAYSMVGDLYYEGLGVEKNFGKAMAYYLKAEEAYALSAASTERMALCYETGADGVEKDVQRADQLRKHRTEPLDAFFKIIKMK